MRRADSLTAIALLAFGVIVQAAHAQSQAPSTTRTTAPPDQRWRHTISPYLLAAGMSGEIEIGAQTADVDDSFSDILDDLEMGGMLAYRGERGNWSLMGNVIFVGLGATKDLEGGGTAEVDEDQAILEFDTGYHIAEQVEIYWGLRGVDIETDLEVRRPNGARRTAGDGESWIDPLVGLRGELTLGRGWWLVARGDVGGFGVGSDLSWQAMINVGWQVSRRCGFAFGHYALDQDYEEGSGEDLFRYDVLVAGPLVAFTYTF